MNCRICRTCLHVTVRSEGSNLLFISFWGMVKYGSSFLSYQKAGAVCRILGTTGVFSWDMGENS